MIVFFLSRNEDVGLFMSSSDSTQALVVCRQRGPANWALVRDSRIDRSVLIISRVIRDRYNICNFDDAVQLARPVSSVNSQNVRYDTSYE